METENDKTRKIMDRIRAAKPVFNAKEEVTEAVMTVIAERRRKIPVLTLAADFLFGWTEIFWLRRTLSAVAVSLVLLIGIQQLLILRKLNNLPVYNIGEERVINTRSGKNLRYSTARNLLLRRGDEAINMGVSQKEIEDFVKSLNEFQFKYRDLIRLLEDNPELRKYVEERVSQMNKKKPKL